MASISGTLRVGEANATVSALTTRQHGSNASYYVILLTLMGVGLLIGLAGSYVLADAGRPVYGVGGPMGVAAGAFVYLLIKRRLVMARFKRRFQERQHALELPLRMEVSTEHLRYEVGGVTQLAAWSAVDELFRSNDYWIFLAQAHALFAPRRMFASDAEEKTFLREALSNMNESARARSVDAVRFTSGATS